MLNQEPKCKYQDLPLSLGPMSFQVLIQSPPLCLPTVLTVPFLSILGHTEVPDIWHFAAGLVPQVAEHR